VREHGEVLLHYSLPSRHEQRKDQVVARPQDRPSSYSELPWRSQRLWVGRLGTSGATKREFRVFCGFG
jgi:hypothetical protein